MAHKRPTPSGLNNPTEQIDVTFGAFDLPHGFRVPYMTSLLRFQQVAEYLDLVTADPKYVTQDWDVEELFQREVSHVRVLDLVDHYLKTESRPQFFNSLTIVLRPREIGHDSYQPPLRDPAYDRRLALGPIMVSYDTDDPTKTFPRPLTHGRLSWNRGQVYAVAIDGQHRLAAIKQLRRDAGLTSSLSVLFIILDDKLGFSAPAGWNPITAMRSIFVDLNKRAEPVSRARNLLLDDIDPAAQFVRRHFGPSLRFESADHIGPLGFPVGSNREFDSRIPLVLVDWHGETRSKIEQGPYLSSVLALDWIVKKTLSAKHPKKPSIPNLLSMSADDEDYYTRIKNRLRHWDISWNGGIENHWTDCRDSDMPFFLSTAHIKSLADEYEGTWGRPITRILTSIGPYAELVRLRIEGESLNPQFSQWYQAKADREAHAKSRIRIRRHYEERLELVEETLKGDVSLLKYKNTLERIEQLKNESVFFYLVGQRALVFSLISLVESRNASDLADDCDLPIGAYKDNLQDFYAHYLAQAIDSVWNSDPAVFTKGYRIARKSGGATDDLPDAFWAGTLVRRDQTQQVDFSEKAAQRGSVWFSLIAHLYWFVKVNEVATEDDIEMILSAVEDDSVLDDWVLGSEVVEAIGAVVGSSAPPTYYVSPMWFLAGMLEDPREEIARAAAQERIRAILRTLVNA